MFTPIVVTGTYLQPSGTGDGLTPSAGTVSFQLSALLQDSTDKEFVDAITTPLLATLNGSGQISIGETVGIVLIANDDDTTQPTGSTWIVTERITGAPSRTYDVIIPHTAAGGTIDLAQLSPSTSTPMYSYILAGSVYVPPTWGSRGVHA
jgi:hypothetical protein